MLKIGLSGKMTSGKSLVARYLVEHHGFIELAFAARLKEIASEMFDIDVAQKDERGRILLQQFADHMRQIDPLVWLRYVVKQVPNKKNVVISDVRYQNEYNALKQLGFYMVRMAMDRPTQELIIQKVYPGVPLLLLDHISETDLDKCKFDYYINNSGGVPLEEVYRQVEHMVLKAGKVQDER